MLKVIKFKLQSVIDKSEYKNMSDRGLATKIGISHVALWKMRTNWRDAQGKAYNPSLPMLDTLCEFFGKNPGQLLEHKK